MFDPFSFSISGLFPKHAAIVFMMILRCLCCNVEARADGFPDRKKVTKWRELHASARCPGQRPPSKSSMCSADDLYLHLPRTRDAWTVLQSKHLDAATLTADLSQSVTRAGVCTDGRLPCVTPGSILAVGAAGRLVTPLEKLMVHGIPVHRMRFPSGVTPRGGQRNACPCSCSCHPDVAGACQMGCAGCSCCM